MTEQEKQRLRDQHWSWLKMIGTQTAFGMAMGAWIGILIIYYDVRRIGSMIAGSDHWFGFGFLLLFSFATLCGMVAGGAAIWLRAEFERDE